MTAPREQISLDGDWQFAVDDAQVGLEEHWYENESVFDQSIQVPGCWQAQVGRGRLLITSFVFEGLQRHPEVDALAGVLIAYLLNPQIKCASTLSANDLREWAWGSVKGEAVTDYVPYLM